MVKYIVLVVAGIIGATLYRLGGAGEIYGKNNKLWRRIGIPVLAVLYLSICGHMQHFNHWSVLAMLCTMGLLVGANSSYYTFNKSDATALNWAIVGLANGIAVLPYCMVVGNYWAMAIRTIFLVTSITIWSCHVENATAEELGRGALIILSLMLIV